jgi:anthranilate phosphoribosyltransferase
MKRILEMILKGSTLERAQAREAMDLILEMGNEKRSSPEQVAAFLSCIRMRGETVAELNGFLDSILARSTLLDHGSSQLKSAIDLCGTGGDGSGTFNISTTCAFVLAGAGVPVAKHGNRAVSSACGSADVLKALKISVELTSGQFLDSLEKTGFGFLFAQAYHPHLASVAGLRKALGVRTSFNILGPLLNPARVSRQVIGVFDPTLCEKLCETLRERGSREVMVVSGECDGDPSHPPTLIDEISLSGPTRVAHLENGMIRTYIVTPEDAGLPRAGRDELMGGSAEENADTLKGILEGRTQGAKRNVVLLNSAAAFLVARQVKNISDGVNLARKQIDQGHALAALEKSVEFARKIETAKAGVAV